MAKILHLLFSHFFRILSEFQLCWLVNLCFGWPGLMLSWGLIKMKSVDHEEDKILNTAQDLGLKGGILGTSGVIGGRKSIEKAIEKMSGDEEKKTLHQVERLIKRTEDEEKKALKWHCWSDPGLLSTLCRKEIEKLTANEWQTSGIY